MDVQTDGAMAGGHDSSTTRKKKRPRTGGTAIACDRCRKMKQACPGTRPSCASCLKRQLPCVYDLAPLDHETRQAAAKRELRDHKAQNDNLRDSVSLLLRQSDDTAMQVLRRLKMAESPIDELANLRHWIDSERSSRAQRPHRSPTRTGLATLLCERSPFAYPVQYPCDASQILRPLDGLAYQDEPFTRLAPQATTPGPPQHFDGSVRIDVRGPSEPVVDPISGQHSTQGVQAFPQVPLPTPTHQPAQLTLIDKRLELMDVARWTQMPISNDTAGKMISLYLEIDHPLLAFFDAELFLGSLVYGGSYCTTFLLTALLAWACNAYAPELGSEVESLRGLLIAEANRLWYYFDQHQDHDFLTVAGLMALAMTYSTAGLDNDCAMLKSRIIDIGRTLRMFDVSVEDFNAYHHGRFTGVDNQYEFRAKAFVAWGVYAWINFHSENLDERRISQHPFFEVPVSHGYTSFMGGTFSAVCSLRQIAVDIKPFTPIYGRQEDDVKPFRPLQGQPEHELTVELVLAAHIFDRMLRWAADLQPLQRRSARNPHHVTVLHIWFHLLVLDLFSPFMGQDLQFGLAAGGLTDGSPEDVFDASLTQLKSLVLGYRSSYRYAHRSLLWHRALLYIATSALGSAPALEADFYWRQCSDAYLELATCFSLAGAFLRAVVAAATDRQHITSAQAQQILARLSMLEQGSHVRPILHGERMSEFGGVPSTRVERILQSIQRHRG